MQDKPNSIRSQLHPTTLTFLPWSIYDMAKVKSLGNLYRHLGHMQPWISELAPPGKTPDQCRDGGRWLNIIYPLGSMYAVHSTRFLWKEVAELSGSCPQWRPAQLCTLDRLFFILCFPLQNPSSVPWDHFSKIHSPKPIVQALLFLQELEVGAT